MGHSLKKNIFFENLVQKSVKFSEIIFFIYVAIYVKFHINQPNKNFFFLNLETVPLRGGVD